MERLEPDRVEAHIVTRVLQAMEHFGLSRVPVQLGSRLKEDLRLITNCDSSPYDTLTTYLVEDFGWSWISVEDEDNLQTVQDLVTYFSVHYTAEGTAVRQLAAENAP